MNRLLRGGAALSALLALLLVYALPLAQARVAGKVKVRVVKASIFGEPQPTVPGKILFSPKTIGRGTVVFRVTNTDGEWHRFEINNVTSRLMGPNGGKAELRVTFKKPGMYFASCPDNTDVGISGIITVTGSHL